MGRGAALGCEHAELAVFVGRHDGRESDDNFRFELSGPGPYATDIDEAENKGLACWERRSPTVGRQAGDPSDGREATVGLVAVRGTVSESGISEAEGVLSPVAIGFSRGVAGASPTSVATSTVQLGECPMYNEFKLGLRVRLCSFLRFMFESPEIAISDATGVGPVWGTQPEEGCRMSAPSCILGTPNSIHIC